MACGCEKGIFGAPEQLSCLCSWLFAWLPWCYIIRYYLFYHLNIVNKSNFRVEKKIPETARLNNCTRNILKQLYFYCSCATSWETVFNLINTATLSEKDLKNLLFYRTQSLDVHLNAGRAARPKKNVMHKKCKNVPAWIIALFRRQH